MGDALDALGGAGSLGATGILALFVLAILTGKLIPRRALDDAIADRNSWREALTTSEEARHVQSAQITALTDVSRTTQHLAESLHSAVITDPQRPT